MPTNRVCSECGKPLAADGGCPVCALKRALALSEQGSEAPVIEQAGDRIGRYKLLEKIGEGGYGVVYMAEQAEPIRRRVALKIVKLGMDTKQVIARFEAERQALALMDHPNIAKVLDAGATDTGRPYFVMDLVRGIKITDYCDQHNLSTKERLDLFMQVCHAVQHAHQKGIIHRDLKPSNILVTEQDGKPVPKVIDFGIAKATQQPLTDNTLFTGFHQFVGTPAYMSPEQAGMADLDIDTRSDIYALGVLLYELLTGHLPFEKKKLLQVGLDEMRRLIREREPPKPSTRLSLLAAGDLTNAAKRRRTEPPKLVHLVRGDLDWIVMKCLEKERTRRYETPNSLACDVERHLDGQPVEARPPSRLYRLGKLVRRNKLALTAAVAVFAALAIGLGFSLWSLRKARREASQREQVARFLGEMLEGVGPSVALGRDTTILRDILDKTAQRLDKDLKDEPEVEADLRDTIGSVYAELQDHVEAEIMYRKGLGIRKQLFGDEHPAVAQSLNNVAQMLLEQGKLTEAETMHRQALAMRRKLLGNEHPDVAQSLNNLAEVLYSQRKLGDAKGLMSDALVMRRKLLGSENRPVAVTLNNLAWAAQSEGKLAEAETMHREVLAIKKKLLGNEHPDVAQSLHSVGWALWAQGKLAEAERFLREAVAMRKKLLPNEHPDVAASLWVLGDVLANEEKLTDAETFYRDAVAILRKRPEYSGGDLAGSLNSLAAVLAQQGKLAKAETMYREALAIRRKLLGNENRETARTLHSLAKLLAQEGKSAEAKTMFCEELVIARKWSKVDLQMSAFIRLGWDAGKPTEAEAMFREALVIARKSPNLAYQMSALGGLGWALREQGKAVEAEAALREALQMAKRAPNLDFQIYAHSQLGYSLREQRRPLEAAAAFREALMIAKKLERTDQQLFALSGLGWSLIDQGGRPLEAAAALREALMIAKKLQRTDQQLIALSGLGWSLAAQDKLAEAEAIFREQLQCAHAQVPTNDNEVARALGALTLILLNEKKYAETEPLAREQLAINEKQDPNQWLRFCSQSVLGASLLGQGKHAEAEPLLLSGCNGMKQAYDRTDLNYNSGDLKEATKRLVQLYEATDRPQKAAEWKAMLAELEKTAADKK